MWWSPNWGIALAAEEDRVFRKTQHDLVIKWMRYLKTKNNGISELRVVRKADDLNVFLGWKEEAGKEKEV